MAKATAASFLIPFGDCKQESNLRIQVQVERTKTQLTFVYLWEEEVEHILLPTRKDIPMRLDQLWERTCFEAFIGFENSPFYWEINISPSGDWNFYHFDSYRNNPSPEPRITFIQSQLREPEPTTNELTVSFDLQMLLSENPEVNLELGLSAVIEKKDHSKTYWALLHAGSQPDFHLRESFTLKI